MGDKVQARKMVLVSGFALAAIQAYKARSSGETFKSLWGVGVVMLVLSIAADFAPTVAGPFAVLTVLGSLTHGGDRIISQALGGIAKSPGQTGTVGGGTGTTVSGRPTTPVGTTPRGGTR